MREPDRLLSAKEVAAALGVHTETVRRWIRSDRVPYLRAGGVVRMRLADLEHHQVERDDGDRRPRPDR